MNNKSKIDKDTAMAMLRAGHTLAEVANKYGVTRQRIHQIAARHGVESPFSTKATVRRRAEMREMILAGEPDDKIAQHFGLVPRTVMAMRRSLGLSRTEELRKTREPVIERAKQAVEAGMSVYAIARELGRHPQTLIYHLDKLGVKSTAPSRWRDISYRFTLIPQMRAEGRSWREINARVSEIDGRVYRNKQIVYAWCKTNLPHLVGGRSYKKEGRA